MGVFSFFKIVQIIPNRATHHIFIAYLSWQLNQVFLKIRDLIQYVSKTFQKTNISYPLIHTSRREKKVWVDNTIVSIRSNSETAKGIIHLQYASKFSEKHFLPPGRTGKKLEDISNEGEGRGGGERNDSFREIFRTH